MVEEVLLEMKNEIPDKCIVICPSSYVAKEVSKIKDAIPVLKSELNDILVQPPKDVNAIILFDMFEHLTFQQIDEIAKRFEFVGALIPDMEKVFNILLTYKQTKTFNHKVMKLSFGIIDDSDMTNVSYQHTFFTTNVALRTIPSLEPIMISKLKVINEFPYRVCIFKSDKLGLGNYYVDVVSDIEDKSSKMISILYETACYEDIVELNNVISKVPLRFLDLFLMKIANIVPRGETIKIVETDIETLIQQIITQKKPFSERTYVKLNKNLFLTDHIIPRNAYLPLWILEHFLSLDDFFEISDIIVKQSNDIPQYEVTLIRR